MASKLIARTYVQALCLIVLLSTVSVRSIASVQDESSCGDTARIAGSDTSQIAFRKQQCLLQRSSSKRHPGDEQASAQTEDLRAAPHLTAMLQSAASSSKKRLSKSVNEASAEKVDADSQLAHLEVVGREGSMLLWSMLSCFIILNLLLVWYCFRQDNRGPKKVQHELFSQNEKGKVYAYSNEQLLTWSLLLTKTPGIVLSWRVWIVAPCVLTLAYAVSAVVVYESSYVRMLDTKRISEIGKYLRVFISFMLGLFMNNSFQRWHASVSLFRQVLTSVKQLVFTARLMNVRSQLTEELQRKCLLACYILDAEMHIDLSCNADACKEYWDATWKSLEDAGLLTQEEERTIAELRGSQQVDMGRHSTVIWAWIGVVISKIRSEPGVLVPMYVRCVSICHSCLGQVEQLKTSAHVQVPFMYVYLLSTIVHLNNMIMALCSGLEIGASLTGLDLEPKEGAHTAFDSGVIVAMETMLLLIQPLLYQACLVIAHVLNHPFGDQVFHLPVETFILILRDELRVSADSFQLQRECDLGEAVPDDSSGESNASHGSGECNDMLDISPNNAQ